MACVAVCGILSTLANFEMIDKVNSKLPESEQFSQLGWHFAKRLRLSREYRRFYPEGRLRLRVRILGTLMFACVIVAAWSFGLFGR